MHVQGGGWLQFFENEETLKLNSDFSVQMWFSGKTQSIQEAPCILSIQNPTTTLSIYRDININNNLIIYLNNNLILNLLDSTGEESELSNLSESINFDEENFYLLTAIINNTNTSIYLNDVMLLDNIQLTPDNSEIIIGSYLDLNENPNNLWYGYIDEVRLWDMALNSDIINFQFGRKDTINSSKLSRFGSEYFQVILLMVL